MFKLKKIASALASVAMVGATIGLAAATTYPQPFVTNGVADVAIVYGDALDVAAATRIQSSLAGSVTSTGGAVITGESVDLASGSDYIYLNDELNENVQTLTKDDLPVILADGTFTDDDGSDFDFEQTIAVGSSATFAFDNSNNDLDDPALLISLPTTATVGSSAIYTHTVTFDEAVNFTDSSSEGEVIMLFGKSYTVGTATDSDTLVLLGGSDAETINIGETKSLEAGDETFSVTLNGISDSDTPQASLTIGGETKTFTEGQTKSFSGGDLDVFVKTVFRTGENNGFVEIQLGADKLTFEDESEVKSGSDDEEIEGTNVEITGGVNAMTKLEIAVSAADNDVNHIAVGEAFADPVFNSLSVLFESVDNGPTLTGREDTSTDRTILSIESGGNRELLVQATDASGNTQELPFTFQNITQDDNGDDIELWEGGTISDNEYFILNSGNNQHFMQITRMSGLDTTTGDVSFKDLFTGTTYDLEDKNFASGQTVTIKGQTFTVTNKSSSTVTVTSSDYAGNTTGSDIAVFPYLELVSGEDHRFAYTGNVTVLDDFNVSALVGGVVTVTLNLPTGDIDVTGGNATDAVKVGSTTLTVGGTAQDNIKVGSMWYSFTVVDGTGVNATDLYVSVAGVADSGTGWGAPGLLFVEDEDKAETTTTTKNAVYLRTTDDGTYSDALTPLFTATNSDSSAFDDSDFTGYLDTFGTYVLFDSSDDNQDLVTLTYPDSPMFANVFFAEADSTTQGPSSLVPVLDTEASSYAGKNLVVVGGSCVNTVAASLLGSSTPLCGTDWEAATGVSSGQYLIQSFARSGKVATLVAGYNTEDTNTGATAFTTATVDTTVGTKLTGSTVSNLVPVITA